MSRTIDRHRWTRKNESGIEIFGDDKSSSDGSNAELIANILAEAAQGGGKLIAKQQADDAASAAAAAKAAAAKNPERDAAAAAAKKARQAATFARIDAQKAMDQADAVEADKNGPQHVAAKKAMDKAKLLEAAAKAAEEKLAYYDPTVSLSTDDSPGKGGKGKGGHVATGFVVPTWVWYAAGGVGALGATLLIVKLVRGHHRSRKGK